MRVQQKPLLFLAPTGLAVGLALKEFALRRPDRRRFAPRARMSPRLGPPLPGIWRSGDSAGCVNCGGSVLGLQDKCHRPALCQPHSSVLQVFGAYD